MALKHLIAFWTAVWAVVTVGSYYYGQHLLFGLMLAVALTFALIGGMIGLFYLSVILAEYGELEDTSRQDYDPEL